MWLSCVDPPAGVRLFGCANNKVHGHDVNARRPIVSSQASDRGAFSLGLYIPSGRQSPFQKSYCYLPASTKDQLSSLVPPYCLTTELTRWHYTVDFHAIHSVLTSVRVHQESTNCARKCRQARHSTPWAMPFLAQLARAYQLPPYFPST